jgi:anti-sigma B factor antagonist
MAVLRFSSHEVRGPGGAKAVCLRLNGAVDANTLDKFDQQLRELLEHRRVSVILDCQKLNFICSAGLGKLIIFSDGCAGTGQFLALCRVREGVKVVFDQLGLNSFLKVVANEQAAFGPSAASRSGKNRAVPPPPDGKGK